jgi:hypothetical protein
MGAFGPPSYRSKEKRIFCAYPIDQKQFLLISLNPKIDVFNATLI